MPAQAPAPTVPFVAPIASPPPEPFVAEQQPASALFLPPAEQIEPETLPVEAVLPVAPLRPTTPAQTFDITIPEPTIAAHAPVAEPGAELESSPGPDHWSVSVTPAYTPTFQSVIDEMPTADDVMSSVAEAPAEQEPLTFDAPEPTSFEAPEPQVTRPVTSEMVAIDAFEAFETVWDATPDPELEPARSVDGDASMPDEAVATSPLAGESLGSGIDGQHLWGDEITRDTGDLQAHEPIPEPATPDSAEEAPIAAGWASHTTPELPMPAWLTDDAAPTELFQEHEDPADPLPDALPPGAHEATASSIVGSAPTSSPWSDPRMAAYAAFVTSPDGVPAITNAIANDKHMRGLQVSAALQRLAERIRDGEIDVSSVAPEAPDAAMLASVLAALLGGSTSR